MTNNYYYYQGTTSKGIPRSGIISAASQDRAVEELRMAGIFASLARPATSKEIKLIESYEQNAACPKQGKIDVEKWIKIKTHTKGLPFVFFVAWGLIFVLTVHRWPKEMFQYIFWGGPLFSVIMPELAFWFLLRFVFTPKCSSCGAICKQSSGIDDPLAMRCTVCSMNFGAFPALDKDRNA